MNNIDRLNQKWFDKIQKGESIDITDLYEFSTISLKRVRMHKKFQKYYEKYVSKEIRETYWGILMATAMGRTLYHYPSDLVRIEPIEGLPKIEIINIDGYDSKS